MGTDFLERIGELTSGRASRACCRRLKPAAMLEAATDAGAPGPRRRPALPGPCARRKAPGRAHRHALHAADLTSCRQRAAAGVPLRQVQNAHIRRWVAQMHSGGRSARGIALILSGWRGFYVWLGRQGLIDHNPVQDVRAPKARQAAAQGAGCGRRSRWRIRTTRGRRPAAGGARCRCITELLYGCGLRMGELVGLDVAASGRARAAGSTPRPARPTCWAKAASGAACRWARAALALLVQWLAVLRGEGSGEGRPALFIGGRGQRLTPQHIRVRLKRRQPAGGLATAGAPAHAAPLVRQPRAAKQRRPARGAGAAGPRQHQHHAGLHPARFPAPGAGVRRGASARQGKRGPAKS